MLDLKYIINQIDTVKKGMEKRHATIDFSSLFENEEKRKKLLLEIEQLRHQRNVVSDDIAKMKRSGQDAQPSIEKMKTVSETIKTLDQDLAEVETAIQSFLITLPTCPMTMCPKAGMILKTGWKKPGESPGHLTFRFRTMPISEKAWAFWIWAGPPNWPDPAFPYTWEQGRNWSGH